MAKSAVSGHVQYTQYVIREKLKKGIVMPGQFSPQRAQYEADRFYIYTKSLIPENLIQCAIKGMDAVRAGGYDTGVPL